MKKQNAKTQRRKDAKIDTEQQAWAQRFALAHPWASRGRKRGQRLLRRIALSRAARPRMRPKAAHALEPKGISLRPCVFAFCCSASAKQLQKNWRGQDQAVPRANPRFVSDSDMQFLTCHTGFEPLEYIGLGGDMKKTAGILAFWTLAAVCLYALEAGQFRLMSLANANKLILISQSPDKPRFLLDATTAKITVDGKPAEFKELSRYSVVNVKFELKKSRKDGIPIDGTAMEIRILTPEQPKKRT